MYSMISYFATVTFQMHPIAGKFRAYSIELGVGQLLVGLVLRMTRFTDYQTERLQALRMVRTQEITRFSEGILRLPTMGDDFIRAARC
jgi:hypothetical protein